MQSTNQWIKHTVTASEKESFAKHVNEVLGNDPLVKDRLPVSGQEIFNQLEDGLIFCKLINAAVNSKVPPISPQAINSKIKNVYQKLENLNLAISSAKSIGCMVINVRPEFIMQKRQHIVLGLVWQIIKIHLNNQIINIVRHPQIAALMKEDQTLDMMMKLGYEQILIRWFNYHIHKNGGTRMIKNLGPDLSDSEAYGHVLTNVANLDKSFWGKDHNRRAVDVIDTCIKEKILTKVKPQDIVSGNIRLNTILAAEIFNLKHGLETKDKKIIELPAEPETDESRQIRIFKNWINSQGIDEVYVNYLMRDLRDGRILLKVLDNFKPGIVDWKKYSDKLKSRIHIIQNSNYVLQICKNLGIKLIGVDGVDLVDGKTSLTLGVVWQVCKIYWESRVGKINQEQLVNWANQKVPQQFQIKNFKDPSISDCKFLLHLINSLKSETVDFSVLKQGNSQEDIIANINYTIASARKLGAEVITLWQHIKESNPKFIGVFIAELQHIQKTLK